MLLKRKRHRIRTLGAAYLGAFSLLASSIITPLSAHAAEQAQPDCDAILNTMDDLHLPEENILVEVGEYYKLAIEPVEAAKSLGWEIDKVEFSSPDLVARHDKLPEDVEEVTTADGKQPVQPADRIQQTDKMSENPSEDAPSEEKEEETEELKTFIEGLKTGSVEIKVELANPTWEQFCTHGHAKRLTLTCETQTVPAGYKAALQAKSQKSILKNFMQNFRNWSPMQKIPEQTSNNDANSNSSQNGEQNKDDASDSDDSNNSDDSDDSKDDEPDGSGKPNNKPDDKPGDDSNNPDIGEPPIAPVDPDNSGDSDNSGDVTTPTDPDDSDNKDDGTDDSDNTDDDNSGDDGNEGDDDNKGDQDGTDEPNPDNPEIPNPPTDPDNPDKPVEPENPEQPDQPEQPDPDNPPVEELKKYDTSTWGFDPDQLSFVYDGQEHHPVLTGVPEEVKVKVVASEVNAGQYTYRVAFEVPEGYEDVPDMAVDYEITPLTPEITYVVNPVTGILEMTTTGILQEDLDGEIQTSIIDATDTELSVLSVTPGYYNIKTQMKIAEDKKGNYTIPEIDQSEYLNVTESNPWLNFDLEYSEENGQLIVKVNIKDLKIPQVGTYDKLLTGLKLFYDKDRLEYVSQQDGDWSQYIMDMMSMNRITAEYNGAVNGGNPLPENSTIAILTFNYKDPNDKADLIFTTGTFGVRDSKPQDICPDNLYGQSPQRDFYYQSGGNFISVANPTGAIKVNTQYIDNDPMNDAFFKGQEADRDNALAYLQDYVDRNFEKKDDGGLGGSDDGDGNGDDNTGNDGNGSNDQNQGTGDNNGATTTDPANPDNSDNTQTGSGSESGNPSDANKPVIDDGEEVELDDDPVIDQEVNGAITDKVATDANVMSDSENSSGGSADSSSLAGSSSDLGSAEQPIVADASSSVAMSASANSDSNSSAASVVSNPAPANSAPSVSSADSGVSVPSTPATTMAPSSSSEAPADSAVPAESI